MKAVATVLLLLGFACTAWNCGSSTQKRKPKLDRVLIGEELQFGRKAAEYDLWREAIFRWEKVRAADPDNSRATNNLAVAYESIGDYEQALDLYKRALELNEDNNDIRKNYKRFLSFYKRHQRQLARERQRKGAEPQETGPVKQTSQPESGGRP
ncbi:tetratricopeptide repeat protein [Acanthopleuribacter pedis]|uniref:Tetratricopeptide repeat protein n=1 Tax=Acanthopleuribacter pedis TaxID=442870 RepID=A0A8J7U4D4_9BACT|nr:tetratricopeptide repeat protein [Acanthopleuribacter pedis]MBO1318171.1 tetratricopeptide repeat protein [Acanthopleuribacter pedis]